jgi:hypothetical protein
MVPVRGRATRDDDRALNGETRQLPNRCRPVPGELQLGFRHCIHGKVVLAR